MFEKAYFDEKVGQIFLVSVVPWTDSLLSDFGQGSLKSKDTQKPEKCDIFRQNRRNQASKVSIFANLQGLPGGGAFGAD